MWSMPMNSDQKREARQKSMQGTALFGLSIIAGIAAAVTGTVWLGGLAVALLVFAVILLYKVGKSLP
jgi:signal transduction histidine kinase